MLLPREQGAWNCGYYLGAIALKALRQSPDGKSDLPRLQRQMGELMARSVSPTQVLNAVAWLFLIDAVQLDENGMLSDATR
jgi:hypothetical protein